MTDALSESSRATERRNAHRACLAAICDFLEDQTDARADAMLQTCERAGEISRQPIGGFETIGFAMLIVALREGDESVWAEFLADNVGFEDPKLLNRYRAVSPFKECVLVVIEDDARRSPVASGETVEFFAAMRDDTLVETRRFRIRDETGGATFLALRPLLLR